MATSFPAIKPTGRRVVQGQYAVKRFVSIAGTGTTRAYGSQPFNATIDLEFGNIADAIALQIVNAYEAANGSKNQLTLPDELWDGMDTFLRSKLQRDYVWRFAEQPQLTSVRPGLSSMTVKLEGQRDG
jgi:hypothetical protein